MYNFLGHTSEVTRWTTDAIICYKRGCVCTNCPMREIAPSINKCHMKAAVLELVRIHGIPKKNGSFVRV